MDDKFADWLFLGIIGFMGGIAANICVPSLRGAWGFAAAAFLGVFCGGVAGISAHAAEAHPAVQYLLAAIAGVIGYPLIALIRSLKFGAGTTTINNEIHGGAVQQNIDQDGGVAELRENNDVGGQ